MNRVIQDGKELFDVTVTINGTTFTVEKNHGKDGGPVANSGGGPGEEPPPPKK